MLNFILKHTHTSTSTVYTSPRKLSLLRHQFIRVMKCIFLFSFFYFTHASFNFAVHLERKISVTTINKVTRNNTASSSSPSSSFFLLLFAVLPLLLQLRPCPRSHRGHKSNWRMQTALFTFLCYAS